MPQASATFIPGGPDDFSLPEVISPSPQRVTPHIPQDIQDDLQRLELDGYRSSSHEPPTPTGAASRRDPDPPGSANTSLRRPAAGRAYSADGMDREAFSFSPFPKVTGDQVPPADDAKEDILWNARKHVLHSQNVSMQISWARDALIWVDIAADAAAREPSDKARPATPRVEHELREDTMNINYLARQEHPTPSTYVPSGPSLASLAPASTSVKLMPATGARPNWDMPAPSTGWACCLSSPTTWPRPRNTTKV